MATEAKESADDLRRKYLLMGVGLVLAIGLEALSLSGVELPRLAAYPIYVILLSVFGREVLKKGLLALMKFNFRSINLLMTLAVMGAIYLNQWEEAVVVVVLFALAEELESYGFSKSKAALYALLEKAPKKVEIKGNTTPIPVEEAKIGQVMVIRPGEAIPLDGTVKVGFSSVDESSMTGEPLPKDKHPGDKVFAGSLNRQGSLEVEITALAADSSMSRIVNETLKAASNKAPSQKFIEKFSRYYTPSVVFAAILLAVIPPAVGFGTFDKWLAEALSLLVISCPCALVISTPISVFSAVGRASKDGILVKGGDALEACAKLRAVAFDKTRTLTLGEPQVTDILPFGKTSEEELLACLAGLEAPSEHPLAKSIFREAQARGLTPHEAKNFHAIPGKGLTVDCVVCHDKHHCVGKLPFISEEHEVQKEVVEVVDRLYSDGKTAVVVATNSGVEGVVALSDAIREESMRVIADIKALGIEPVMLTGDHESPARFVGRTVGIEKIVSGLLPEQKSSAIREISAQLGPTAMVGDGVNDAPALASASVGISMAAVGSAAAIEASSIAILNDRLDLVPYLVRLGRRTLSTIRFNTGLAVGVKSIFLVLALAGHSSLVMAIVADVGLTLLVVLNSLRVGSLNYRI
jgi:Zn2+/Cd2+-exporting ATPase